MFPLENNLLDESVKQRTGFEKQMKHSIDAVLDTVRVCVKENDLSDHMKERSVLDIEQRSGTFPFLCYQFRPIITKITPSKYKNLCTWVFVHIHMYAMVKSFSDVCLSNHVEC